MSPQLFNHMKKLNIYYALVFLLLATPLFLPVISYAVPAAPSPICAINATVLTVQKVKTNISGLGQPPRTDFYYYSVKLKIGSSSCDNLKNSEQDSILSLVDYDKSPVSVGQKIDAKINFEGDEWFNGYFLSEIKVLSVASVSKSFTNIILVVIVALLVGGVVYFGGRKFFNHHVANY